MCDPSYRQVDAFDNSAEAVRSARRSWCDSREREVDPADDISKYTIGRIPELCELCVAEGEQNVAVKSCMTCTKQICTSCIDAHKHLEACDQCDKEIVAIVADAYDGNYAIGKIPELCELCAAVGEREAAVKYCMSCEKHICTFCVDAHRRFVALTSHTIVDTEPRKSNHQLRSTKCEQHVEKDLDTFCITHNLLCCVTCADINHNECALTTNIAAMESGSRKAIASVKQKYQRIENYMVELRARNVKNNVDFKKKVEHLKRHLENKKLDIKSTLEAIQMNFSVRSENLLAFQEKAVESNIEKIDKVKLLCRARIEKIDNVTEADHPAQIIAMKNTVIADYLDAESDIDNEDIKEENMHCRCPLLSKLSKFEEQLIENAEEEVMIVREKVVIPKCENVVNVLHKRKIILTDRHKVRLVPDCSPTYHGIAALSGGKKLALSDCCEESNGCGNVCLYDIKNRSQIKLKFSRPFGIAELRSDPFCIAVTLPVHQQILIISTKENCLTTVKAFQTNKIPLSLVSLDNGCLGATFHSPPSFDLIDLSGKYIKTLKSYTHDSAGRNFRSFEYVAVDEFRSHIIQPCQENNAVYSFHYSGEPVFEYRDLLLREPHGVGLDKEGNIYVCSYYNHMIHVLEPTGIRLKYFTHDVPIYSLSICFDESGEKFWISNTAPGQCDTLHLFSLK